MCSAGPLEVSPKRQRASFTIDAILERPWRSNQSNEASETSHVSPASSSSGLLAGPNRVDVNPNNSLHCYSVVRFSDQKDGVPIANSLHTASTSSWNREKTKLQPAFYQTPTNTKCSLIGRSPRVPFTRSQVEGLEAKFRLTNYLSSREVTTLANQLHVTETRVKIWFQNRRARQRREAFVREVVQTSQQRPSQLDQSKASEAPPVAHIPVPTQQNPLSTELPLFERDLLHLASTTSRGIFGDALTASSYPIHELATFYQQNFNETWF